MEHTEQDINNINFGNRQLDNLLINEESTRNLIVNSTPLRWIISCGVYNTLRKLGELLKWENTPEEIKAEYISEAMNWEGVFEKTDKTEQVARCVLVFATLSEKRLAKTTGV